MIDTDRGSQPLSNGELLAATRELCRKSQGIEADLLVHLGEIDERKLYLDCAFPSMFAFCVAELGFSEDAAYNRITVARAARRFPAVIETIRSGQVHLAGLRLLAPHLTPENHAEVLAQAARKSKREIEELVARLAPQPPVAATIRKLPCSIPSLAAEAAPVAPAPPARPVESPPIVSALAEETFRIQFTASRALRDKLREAQDLLRHQNPTGDMALIFERALDLLIDTVKKERFAVGRKPRQRASDSANPGSRHIPDAVKRAVYERDQGRCTFLDDGGRRCCETGSLEFDHIDGFARTREHDADRIRLLCHAHNQHAAEQMYGRAFMKRARTRPGTSTDPTLF
jgi:hypothetical protein